MPYSYRTLTRALTAAGIQEAADEARLLLEHFAGVSQVTLMTERDRVFDGAALDAAVARRLERYPLQYLLGAWDFYGLTFEVSEHVLIPRPDTEILVEEAVRHVPAGGRFADLCTGSGCIPVALLHTRRDLTGVALELYPDTLALAEKNAETHGVTPRFTPVLADLLRGGVEALEPYAPFDAILSNPPYIPSETVRGLSPEVLCEPPAALDGGEDGLLFYRAILRDYPRLLKAGGQILLEIGYDQAEDLRVLCAACLPDATLRVVKDLGGNDRVVHITLPAP